MILTKHEYFFALVSHRPPCLTLHCNRPPPSNKQQCYNIFGRSQVESIFCITILFLKHRVFTSILFISLFFPVPTYIIVFHNSNYKTY